MIQTSLPPITSAPPNLPRLILLRQFGYPILISSPNVFTVRFIPDRLTPTAVAGWDLAQFCTQERITDIDWNFFAYRNQRQWHTLIKWHFIFSAKSIIIWMFIIVFSVRSNKSEIVFQTDYLDNIINADKSELVWTGLELSMNWI